MDFSQFREPKFYLVLNMMRRTSGFAVVVGILLLLLLQIPLGMHLVEQKIEKNNAAALQQTAQQQVQSAVDALDLVADMLYSSTSNVRYIDVGRTTEPDSEIEAGLVYAELSRITEMCALICSAYLVCNLNHRIYHSLDGTSYEDSEFYDLAWRQQYYASKGGMQVLDTPRTIQTPSRQGEQYISLISRVPYFSTLQNKCLIFNISLEDLSGYIVHSDSTYGEEQNRMLLWIYNSKGELMWDQSGYTAPSAYAELELASQNGEQAESWKLVTVNEIPYMAVSVSCSDYGWTFVECIPYSYIQQECRSYTVVLVLVVGLSTAAIALVLFAVAYKRQTEILRAGQKVYQGTQSDMKESEDFLAYLQRVCLEKNEQLARDEMVLETFSGALTQTVVQALIGGEPIRKNDQDAYREMMRSIGLLGEEPQKYVVFLVRVEAISALKMNLHQDIYSKFRRVLQYSCNEQLLEGYQACYAWTDYSTMIGILHFPERIQAKQVKLALNQMGQAIQKQLTLLSEQPVVVAFGDEMKSPWYLVESYEHAKQLVQHKVYYRRERPYTYQDMVESEMKMSYDHQKQLVDQIKLGKVQEASALLESYFTILHSNPYAELEQVKEICIGLVETIHSAIAEKAKNMEGRSADARAVKLRMQEFSTVHEVADCLLEYATAAAEAMQRQMQQKKDIRVQDVLEWIESNYNQDISLDDIARQMDLSPTYASKQIKAYTGQSVVNYINQVRIEHAKELLITTKMSSNEIGAYVGFRYSQSFIRTFRKNVGMTPGNYRSLHQKDGKAPGPEDLPAETDSPES